MTENEQLTIKSRPLNRADFSEAAQSRFWKKAIIQSDGCWIWTAAISNGYGSFWNGGTAFKAHRVSFCLHNGCVPENMIVLHVCDTPLCVNPNHLKVGYPRDNSEDMVKKGRWRNGGNHANIPRGEQHNHSKLTVRQVLEIRSLMASGEKASSISKRYPVNAAGVRNVWRKKTWAYVPDAL